MASGSKMWASNDLLACPFCYLAAWELPVLFKHIERTHFNSQSQPRLDLSLSIFNYPTYRGTPSVPPPVVLLYGPSSPEDCTRPFLRQLEQKMSNTIDLVEDDQADMEEENVEELDLTLKL
ncbi:hypothetical protein ACFE04_006827 [Oxalis oulophora]